MARSFEIFLYQHLVVAETGQCFALAGRQRSGEFITMRDHAHAFATTTGTGLQQHGVANALCRRLQGGHGLVSPMVTRHHRHTSGFHQCFGCALSTHGANGGGRRTDEFQAGSGTCFGEIGVLGKKSIAGVDSIGARSQCCSDDSRTVKVRLTHRSRPEADCFIG